MQKPPCWLKSNCDYKTKLGFTASAHTLRNTNGIFKITTAFSPQCCPSLIENESMKNEIKIISTFLFLNATIISIAIAFYVKKGIQFEKLTAFLLSWKQQYATNRCAEKPASSRSELVWDHSGIVRKELGDELASLPRHVDHTLIIHIKKPLSITGALISDRWQASAAERFQK